MIRGYELYELLQSQCPAHFWAKWEMLNREIKAAYDIVAAELNDRQAEAVHTAIAGEDI